jgi:hypothetical protein
VLLPNCFLRGISVLSLRVSFTLSLGLLLVCFLTGSNAFGACPLPLGTNDPPTLMDFNLDGKSDVLWRHKASSGGVPDGDNYAWLMNGTNISLPVFINNNGSGSSWKMTGIGDFNGDHKNDILWQYQLAGDLNNGLTAVWYMGGVNGTVLQSWASFVPTLSTNWLVCGGADFNRDGNCDILWQNLTSGVKGVYFMDNSFQKVCSQPFGDAYNTNSVGTNWSISATADLNGDHIPDIVLRDQTIGYVALWYMKYDTSGISVLSNNLLWNPATTNLFIQPDQDWKIVGAGNFHNWTNGYVDLLVRHATLGWNGLWTINGTNYIGGTLITEVFDTDFRIASQDISDSYWRLQSDFHKLSATASTSPTPRITLNFYLKPLFTSGNGVTIQRRLASQTTEADWQTLQQHLAATTYIDADIFLQVGQRYEYRVFRETNPGDNNFPNFMYPVHTFAAINAPPIEKRGKIILLIDNTLVSQLTTNITRLQNDLVGDGWTVITNHVARHNDTTWSANTSSIASIKSYITTTYNADPNNTNVLFILGHVAIPYSGINTPDGHDTNINQGPDHRGAWPSDIYYTDISGTWTDNLSLTNFACPTNSNFVSDGKFDQNVISNRVQLAIGRVDFANLPVFAKTEVQLIKDYLDKDRRFRLKQLFWQTNQSDSAYELGVVYGSFAGSTWNGFGDRLNDSNTGTFENAVKNCSSLFGDQTGKLIVGDPFYQRNRSYLLAFQAGSGWIDSINAGEHTSGGLTDTTKEPTAAFYGLWGSFFGDWNLMGVIATNVIYSNFMRSMLTSPDYGLATFWAGNLRGEPSIGFVPTILRLDTMAMGEHLGRSLLQMVNDPANPTTAISNGRRERTILGDPSLRLHILAPPANLTAQINGNQATMTWTTNNAAGVQYYIYKSSGINGPFTRISTNAVNGPSFTNSPYSTGTNYMVRSLQLKTSGSGSYTNISQGSYWP